MSGPPKRLNRSLLRSAHEIGQILGVIKATLQLLEALKGYLGRTEEKHIGTSTDRPDWQHQGQVLQLLEALFLGYSWKNTQP